MRHLKPLLITILAVAALTISCVDPIMPSPTDVTRIPEGALVLSPEILGVPATKATIAGDDLRNENKISTLDVFVYRKFGSGPDGATRFFHRYTLTAEDGGTLVSGGDYVLEPDWRTARYGDVGYEGNTFKIYVIANLGVNIRPEIPEAPSEDELKQMVSVSKETISGSYDVVRLVDGKGPGENDWYNPHIKDNLFLMDGVIDDWVPIQEEAVQYFTKKADKSFELARAAAKFCISLDFDPEFLATLGTADTDKLNFTKIEETWENGKTKVEVVTSIGNIQYKYANFMPVTYDFDPEISGVLPDALKNFRDANLWESTYRYDFSYRTPLSTGGFKYPYIDTTYSYAFSWDAGVSAEKAPALAASIGYTRTTRHYDSDGNLIDRETKTETEWDYYRIPLVDVVNVNDPVTEVKRNYLYQVDALITSMGASIIDIEPTNVKLNYKVIPWSFNPATDVTEVVGAQLYYFSADTTYTLRGENTQFVYLDYFTPKSAKLSSGLYEFEPVLSNVFVYYMPDGNTDTPINAIGTGSYTGSNTKWTGTKARSNEKVSIEVQPKPDGGGQVYITSDVLANRAVKYIEFDATASFKVPNLDGNGQPDGTYSTVSVKRHYIIKHFPLDNIQSVTGSWSSRASYEYSDTPVEGWIEETFEETLGPSKLSSYFDNDWSYTFYRSFSSSYYEDWPTSENDAKYFNGWYYWRTSRSTSQGFTYTFHRVQYLYRNPVISTSTGRWFDWERDNGKTYIESLAKYTYDGSNFEAKVYYNRRVYPINVTRTNSSSGYRYSYSRSTRYNTSGSWNCYWTDGTWDSSNSTMDLTNNHMYIIQISKADDNVLLGRPMLDSNFQSNDNVVSPAFMIASQLGAVSSFRNHDDPGGDAAVHCATYLEVAENGARFAGWRLPTKNEVQYIVDYQRDKINISGQGMFEDVLTGGHYYTLDGGYAATNYTGDPNYAVRCVRDLSPAEVAELNTTGTITSTTN